MNSSKWLHPNYICAKVVKSTAATATIALFLVSLMVSTSHAQTDSVWIGGTGDWNVPENWLPAGVPDGEFNVFIDDGDPVNSFVEIPADTAFTVDSLTMGEYLYYDILQINDGASLTVQRDINRPASGVITLNNGFIRITNSGSPTSLLISGEVSLERYGGDLKLRGSSDESRIAGSGVFTNYGPIYGKGQIGANSLQVVNEGSISADDSTGSLILDPPPGVPMVNRGGFAAGGGGNLVLTSGSFDNAGGAVVAAGSGSTVTLMDSVSITGGQIRARSGGTIEVASNETAYIHVNYTEGTWNLQDGSELYIAGQIYGGAGGAEFNVNSSGSPTSIKFVDPVLFREGTIINLPTPDSQIVAEENGFLEANCEITGIGLVDSDCLWGGTISPGNSIGTLRFLGTQTIHNNNSWEVDLGAISGTPGVDWDLVDINGVLDLDDGDGYEDSIMVRPTTLNPSGDPGELANFEILADYSWVVAQADTITDFEPSVFTCDLAGFANATDGHFTVWMVDDTKDQIVLNCLGGAMCPGSGSLVEGFGQQNDFSAVCDSDNVYWAAYGATLFFAVTDPVSQFELSTTPPAAYAGGAIKVHLEASKESDDGNLNIRPLMFNFTTGQYVGMPGIMPLTTTDKVQTFELPSGANPLDFIDPETDEVRVLIQTTQTFGLPIVRTKLDQVLINFD